MDISLEMNIGLGYKLAKFFQFQVIVVAMLDIIVVLVTANDSDDID